MHTYLYFFLFCRSMVGCEKFQKTTTKNMNLTNLTILVGSESSDLSGICKLRVNHRLPVRTTIININFNVEMTCKTIISSSSSSTRECSEMDCSADPTHLTWWEIPETVKGFREFTKSEPSLP